MSSRSADHGSTLCGLHECGYAHPDKLLAQAVASRIVARQTPDAHLITEERKRKNYAEFWNIIPVTEPYRCVLAEVRDKLYHTRCACLRHRRVNQHENDPACAHLCHLHWPQLCREVLHHALVHPNVNVREYLENDPEAYYSKDELLEPLTLIYNSLLTCGDMYIAHGRLLDCIRQVISHADGFSFVMSVVFRLDRAADL